MATKPNNTDTDYDIPSAWDGALSTRPSASKITTGWQANEKPPANYFNWFWNFVLKWVKYFDDSIDELSGGQRRLITQDTHNFLNDFIYYESGTSLWTKAIATSSTTLATHFAVRIDDNNFYAYSVGELATTGILDEAGATLTKDTYYYLSDSVAGKCTNSLPIINEEQICFKSNDTYISLFPSYSPSLFTEFAKLNGDSTELFDVLDGTSNLNAVNLGQLNSKQSFTTYCANSGNTDANGYADIITKVSDTEVSFKVGSPYANLGITFPNGKHYEISSIANVTGISADGVYKFIIQEDDLINLYDGTYSATVTSFEGGSITEEYILPTTPDNGDLNLLINQNPLLPQLFNGSVWTDKQFVKIGEVTKSTTLGTPISYAYNGKYYYEQTSGNFINAQTVKNHNIGTTKLKKVTVGAIKYSDSTRYPLRAESGHEPYCIDSNNTLIIVADATPVFNIIASGLTALSIQNAATYGLIVDIERSF